MGSIGDGLNLGKIAAEQLVKVKNELRTSNVCRILELDNQHEFLSSEIRQKALKGLSTYLDRLSEKQ